MLAVTGMIILLALSRARKTKSETFLLTFSGIKIGLMEYPSFLKDGSLLNAVEWGVFNCKRSTLLQTC